MASRRMIHKQIWESEQFSSLTISERLLYVGLVVDADDQGCFRADAKYWKRCVFYEDRVGPGQIQKMLDQIQKTGLIIIGQTEKGVAGCHPNWHHYQTLRPERAKPSKYSELLSANGLPQFIQQTAEEKLSKEKKSEEKLVEDNSAQDQNYEKNMKALSDSWTNAPHHIKNKFK
jgi:hypothetical protein